MFVVPEEEGEGEEGEVVVGSLEAGEAGENDDGEEEFFDVLNHDSINNEYEDSYKLSYF